MNKVENRRSAPRKGASSRPASPGKSDPGGERPEEELLARWVRLARKQPAVRKGLVSRIKAEIDAGTYETPENLKIAIEGLLKDLEGF